MLVWYRRDLRFDDHAALKFAHDSGESIVPVFIADSNFCEPWPAGAARRWWLMNSLLNFQKEWSRRGGSLVFRYGDPEENLVEIAQKTKSSVIVAHGFAEPSLAQKDRNLSDRLSKKGIQLVLCDAPHLLGFEALKNKSGQHFQVFTPFWKALWEMREVIHAPISSPKTDLNLVNHRLLSDEISIEKFLSDTPKGVNWWKSMESFWDVSEGSALTLLNSFIKKGLEGYSSGRNMPSLEHSTSRLSPFLHGGEISPRRIWFQVLRSLRDPSRLSSSAEQFLKEIVWREFAAYTLHFNPQSEQKSLKLPFDDLPWSKDEAQARLWQKGLTGYPIVDAGMRQLWATGWMHNRVRMIVASFLVKDLQLPWQKGAEWFWDTLVDSDLASNTLGWQWTAGCGVDAAPYFRIFHPVLQGEKFDPEGAYVRRWIPELQNVPTKFVHKPWELDVPPTGYPQRVVDHAVAREKILKIFASLKKQPATN